MKKNAMKLVMVLTMLVGVFMFQTKPIAARNYSPLQVSVVAGTEPYTRTFRVSNPTSETMTYEYSAENGAPNAGTGTLAPGASATINVGVDGKTNVLFMLADGDGRLSVSRQSLSYYNIPVYYRAGSTDLQGVSYKSCTQGGSAKITAPSSIAHDGYKYTIQGGNYREAAYGSTSIVFEYAKETRKNYTSAVVFLDQDGNTLKRDSFTVSERAGGSYAVPQEINHNARTYTLMSGYGNISQSYEDGAKTHYVRYQLQEGSQKLPYYVSVDYKAGDVLLTRKTMTVQNGKTVTWDAPDTYKAGTTTYRRTGEKHISHTYGNTKKTYTISYEKVTGADNTPYDVQVKYVDVATGKILTTQEKTVDVDKTVNFAINGSIENGGKTYLLADQQPTTITHRFGSAQTVYTVYVHEKDVQVSKYEITIAYYDLTENKILYSTKLSAEDGKSLQVKAPKSYTKDGKEYVLLSGQDTSYEHTFYSRRRSYTFIYRDKDDLQNQNVVVLPGAGENIVTTPNGTTVTLNNETGRTLINVPDNQTPLTIGEDGKLEPAKDEAKDNQQTETIEDEKTPLSKGEKSTGNQTGIAIGISAVAVLGGAWFIIFLKKKKKASEASL